MSAADSDKNPPKSDTTAKQSKLDKTLPKFKDPGLRQAQTTNVFRVVNFELFVKPVSVYLCILDF